MKKQFETPFAYKIEFNFTQQLVVSQQVDPVEPQQPEVNPAPEGPTNSPVVDPTPTKPNKKMGKGCTKALFNFDALDFSDLL
ncbi:MAG: hypothetical protein Q4C49_11175 [Bacillota bacterium]|nr:hypothetical protein [Bacillota bacterium]